MYDSSAPVVLNWIVLVSYENYGRRDRSGIPRLVQICVAQSLQISCWARSRPAHHVPRKR